MSYEPPRFSREAQPAATNPANANNAINFFIITPFMISSQLPPPLAPLNQAFTHGNREDSTQRPKKPRKPGWEPAEIVTIPSCLGERGLQFLTILPARHSGQGTRPGEPNPKCDLPAVLRGAATDFCWRSDKPGPDWTWRFGLQGNDYARIKTCGKIGFGHRQQ